MSYEIDPYQVIHYHNTVTEFFDEYASEVSANNGLPDLLEKADQRIGDFFLTDSLDYTYPVTYTVILGNAIQGLEDIPIIAPDESAKKDSAEEIYAERLLREKNFWATLYEIKVAKECYSAGFDTKLVEEGTQKGPDVYVYPNKDDRIDIECKRRQEHNTRRNYPYEIIEESVTEEISTDEVSFCVEITSDRPLQNQAISDIIDLVIDVIRNEKIEDSAVINGVEYRVILHDYFTGIREVDMSKSDLERWMTHEEISPQFIDELSSFDDCPMTPGFSSTGQLKITETGNIVRRGVQNFEFSFPTIDEGFYNRIVESCIRRGREDLSGRSPAILYVHLPKYELDDMARYHVQEGEYDPVPQFERLIQRIKGELKDSNSVNAVVLTFTEIQTEGNNCQIRRGYKIIKNQSPETQLPERSEKFLSKDS
jgi:hypothetical protein